MTAVTLRRNEFRCTAFGATDSGIRTTNLARCWPDVNRTRTDSPLDACGRVDRMMVVISPLSVMRLFFASGMQCLKAAPYGAARYTESLARRLLRRRAMTFRPDFVCMRERKPCLRVRFVFFGLNRVIFMVWLCVKSSQVLRGAVYYVYMTESIFTRSFPPVIHNLSTVSRIAGA